MAKLRKPLSVSSDAFRSVKWDELTRGCNFSNADAPALSLIRQLNRRLGMAGGGDALWDQLLAFSAATRLISHKGGWCFERHDLPLDRRR
ncbi:hypothetical protein [Olsenella massiliensis]|uniref:hypothetical protein n=1 Tax=Olsenella massiliensis TaxID=1622075 RepID=UPI00071DDAF2|nr:hypothetical protein [Olsenella massiliensis]